MRAEQVVQQLPLALYCNLLASGIGLTRAMGLAMGYKRMIMPLTTGANVAPIASPYLLQMACGMTLEVSSESYLT